MSYDHGTSVTLTAAPATGYTFVNWTGDVTGSVNPVTVTMDGPKSVTANYSLNTYSLSVTSAHGTVTKAPDQASYDHGTSVQLTAAPATGYTFVNWTGDVTSSENPVTVTMDGPKSVTANYSLNTYAPVGHVRARDSHQGAGPGELRSRHVGTADGGACDRLHVRQLDRGRHELREPGHRDDGRSEVGHGQLLAQHLQPVCHVRARDGHEGPGPGELRSRHVGHTDGGAATGYTFVDWTGDVTGSVNPVTLTMDGPKSVTANYSLNTYALSVTSAHGTVTKAPDQASYDHGTSVTLTAAPATGYTFVNWTGDVTSSENPVTLTMDGPKSVTANYSLNTYACRSRPPTARSRRRRTRRATTTAHRCS